MKKYVLAAILGLGATSALGCGNGSTCAGTSCTSIECKSNEVPAWCRVEITTTTCALEQPFGFCIPETKNGFSPSVDLRTWIWQNAPTPIRALVKASFGQNVGFDILECTGGKTNPYPGSLPNAVQTKVIVKLSNDIKNQDVNTCKVCTGEADCETCAAASCKLKVCGADSNCGCWVACAASDATLASCPTTCGPQGEITTSLVSCLVTTCGPACGVAGSMPSCDMPDGGMSCGMTGDFCGNPGNADCCGICGLDGLCE